MTTSEASSSSLVSFWPRGISSSGRMKVLKIFFASSTSPVLGSKEAGLNASGTMASHQAAHRGPSIPSRRGRADLASMLRSQRMSSKAKMVRSTPPLQRCRYPRLRSPEWWPRVSSPPLSTLCHRSGSVLEDQRGRRK